MEDTTNHTYAQTQLERFSALPGGVRMQGIEIPMLHTNSAATLLWNHAHGDMVRSGIAAYGLWPSNETLITALQGAEAPAALRTALTWKARVAQVRECLLGPMWAMGERSEPHIRAALRY